MNNSVLINPESAPTEIIRALEDGLDYQPDWRRLQTEQYLMQIHSEDTEPLRQARLDQILTEEPDRFVRDFLSFSYGHRDGNYQAIEYAVNCWTNNFKTLFASMIKAMVLADGTPEQIAYEIGATEDKIETFEKLYFDARRYLKRRAWVKSICFPAVKPEGAMAVESRWFAVAFRRAWAGVEEIVLARVKNAYERNLQHAMSVFLGRVEDYCWGLEMSGTPPSESDVKALLALARIHSRGLPVLWDEQPRHKIDPAIAKLSPAGRLRVASFVTQFLNKAEASELARESEGANIETNEP